MSTGSSTGSQYIKGAKCTSEPKTLVTQNLSKDASGATLINVTKLNAKLQAYDIQKSLA